MNIFNKLTQSFGTGKLKKQQIDQLQHIFHSALSDWKITDQELAQINNFYINSELSPEDFNNLKTGIFREVVFQMIADRRITEQEHIALFEIARQLEMPQSWKEWANHQIQYYKLFHYIESGGKLPVGTASNLIPQKGEVCHLSVPATLLEERVVSRQYVGSSRGISVPIVKGIRVSFGQQRGHTLSQTGLVPISEGYFIVTNQRLVFSGSRKSITTPFTKLLDIQLFGDAVQFGATNRQKQTIVKFDTSDDAELSGLVINRLLSE